MVVVILWVILALCVGAFASGRGRSFIGWTLLSLLFSPLIGFVIVAVLSNPKDSERRHQELLDAARRGTAPPDASSPRAAVQTVQDQPSAPNIESGPTPSLFGFAFFLTTKPTRISVAAPIVAGALLFIVSRFISFVGSTTPGYSPTPLMLGQSLSFDILMSFAGVVVFRFMMARQELATFIATEKQERELLLEQREAQARHEQQVAGEKERAAYRQRAETTPQLHARDGTPIFAPLVSRGTAANGRTKDIHAWDRSAAMLQMSELAEKGYADVKLWGHAGTPGGDWRCVMHIFQGNVDYDIHGLG